MLWWRGVTYWAHPNTTDITKLWVTHHNTFNMCQTDKRNDFLLKVDSQHTCTNRSFSFMTNRLCQKTEIRECKRIIIPSHRGHPCDDKLMRAPTKQDCIAWIITHHNLVQWRSVGKAGVLLVRASSWRATSKGDDVSPWNMYEAQMHNRSVTQGSSLWRQAHVSARQTGFHCSNNCTS